MCHLYGRDLTKRWLMTRKSHVATNTTGLIESEVNPPPHTHTTDSKLVCSPTGLLHSAAMKVAVIVAVALLAMAQGTVPPEAVNLEPFKRF